MKILKLNPVSPLCIAIGGVSRSGKTFLANELNQVIENSVVIHQDAYIPAENQIPMIEDHINWEIPEAIDWVGFRSAVEDAIRSGKSAIVEGLMVFQNADINRLYNKSIFLKISREELFLRKQTDLRWGKEPEWYVNHIWNSYLNFGQVSSLMEDTLVIDGEKEIEIQIIMNFLRNPDL